MKNKHSLISLFNIRIIALILAVVMIFTSIDLLAIFGDSLAFPTATAEETDDITDEVLAGSTVRDDALHFLIRHWHTDVDYDTNLNGVDPAEGLTEETDPNSRKNIQTEAATKSYFVLVEGYIIPNKDSKDGTPYAFYLVNQATQTLVNVYEVEDVEVDGEIKTQFKKDANGNKIVSSKYVTAVDEKTGSIDIKIKPLNNGDDDLEVFSGFSISTGRNAFTTHTDQNGTVDYITLQYDSLTHLAKGHVFYTEKRETVPGTGDPAVFTASQSEIDVATVYTYTDLGDEGVECSYHKDDNGQPVTHHNGDIVKYVPDSDDGESDEVACTNDEGLLLAKEQCSAFGCYYDDEGGKHTPQTNDDGSIKWYNVKLTKFYSTNEGLHTDKTLMQAADGRIFLFDLQAWYTEGYAAQLSYILDASGSMLFAFDEPLIMNIYGILSEKLGAVKKSTSETDEATGKVTTTYKWTYSDYESFYATDADVATKLKNLFIHIAGKLGDTADEAYLNGTAEESAYTNVAKALTNNTGTSVTENALKSLLGKIGQMKSGGDSSDWNNAFINDDLLKILLNPRNTDNRSLGTNGYSYYVFTEDSTNGDNYSPLAYWGGSSQVEPVKYTFEIDTKEDAVTGWPKQENGIDYIKMSSGEGYDLTSPRGIILDAKPNSGNFTISFEINMSGYNTATIKEILYIGSMNGNAEDGGYYRLFRDNIGLHANNGTRSITDINATTTSVITLVFEGGKVTSYKDGSKVGNDADLTFADNDINIILNGIQDNYDGTSICIDNIYVFGSALASSDVKTLSDQIKALPNDKTESIAQFVKNREDSIGVYAFSNNGNPISNDKTGNNGGNGSRNWLKNSAKDGNEYDNTGHGLGAFAHVLASKASSFGSNGMVTYGSNTFAQTSTGVTLGQIGITNNTNNTISTDAGWYFVSHGGSLSVIDAGAGTAKRLCSLGKNQSATDKVYKTYTGGVNTTDSHNTNLTYTTGNINTATKFYIDEIGNLRCFYGGWSGDGNPVNCSYVYQLEDSQYSRVEEAQRILANFSTSFSALSPTSYLSAVQFSANDYVTAQGMERQILLDWSSDPTEAANIMSITRGESNNQVGQAAGYTTSPGGVNQYNYVLTGSTYTKAGLQAYAKYLHGYGNDGKLDGHLLKDSDAPKFLVIFTDGLDSSAKDSYQSGYKEIKYKDESGKEQSIWVEPETINLAKDFRDDGYTIVGVLFAGDSMSAANRAKAQAFLSSIVGTKEHCYGSGDFNVNNYFFRAANIASILTLFNEQILAQLVDSLTGYTIQDYIDPRFDLEQGDGTRWRLEANGQVAIEISGYSKELSTADIAKMDIGKALQDAGIPQDKWTLSYEQVTEEGENDESQTLYVNKIKFTLPSGGVRFHVYDVKTDLYNDMDNLTEDDLADITTAARDPNLCYDSSKDMYYLQWVDQTLPTSQVGAVSMMPVWSVTILLHVKDDFIGGNAILTDGNDAYMNWVYHPLDLDVGTEDYDNLTAQQKRNLAEQEAYIELRRDQYAEDYVANVKANNAPTITQDKYVQAHFAKYLWDNLSTLTDLTEDQITKIQNKVNDALGKKYGAITSYENFKSALTEEQYIARDQAQYLYEHLSEYLKEYLTDLSDDELAEKLASIKSAITEALKEAFSGGDDGEIVANQAEYITLKLAENTGKKTDHDASSGTSDMTKVYYPKTGKDADGNTIYVDNDGQQIYIHHDEKTGDFYVTYDEEGKETPLSRDQYERDWNNPIDTRISKGFPRATVNVHLQKIDVSSMYSVVYMGEVVSPAQLLEDIEGDIITDSYYLEYLKRYAYQRYLHSDENDGVNMPLLDLLNKWLQFDNETEYEKSFSIPYMYLPAVQYGSDSKIVYQTDENGNTVKDAGGNALAVVTNSSGFSTTTVSADGKTTTKSHKAFDENYGILADVVGILTYRWEKIEPSTHYNADGSLNTETGDPMEATKNFVKDDTERLRYAITVGFTPLREGDALNGYYVNSQGEVCTNDSEDHKHDNEEYFPGLNDYDDDGDDIFAGYLPIRGNGSSEKWSWGADVKDDENNITRQGANFVFDRAQLVNGYTDNKGVSHGYIKEDAFKWDPSYKPSVYLQQLVSKTEEYTNTDDTVQLINQGQRYDSNNDGEVTDEDEREYAGNPRTLKGYSIYAVNVVSGGITLEFNMLKGELKALFKEEYQNLTDEEYQNLTDDAVILEKTFTVEAERSFTDTEWAEQLKVDEHLSDYGTNFTITFTLKYTKAEIYGKHEDVSEEEEITGVMEKVNSLGYVTVYAEATTVAGTWETILTTADELDAAQTDANANESIEIVEYEDGTNVKVEKITIYEQLPIGSYTFTLSNVNKQAFTYNMQFSTMSGETKDNLVKYQDAYEYFSDVVLNGLHTSNERKVDADGNTVYEPTLAQRRYDATGKLVYITDEKMDPVPIVAAAKGYTEDTENNAWLDANGDIVYKYDDTKKAWLDAKGNDLGYHYNQNLGVWLDANNERVPYYWTKDQMREITPKDEKVSPEEAEANGTEYVSRGIVNYIADSETEIDDNDTKVTFNLGTVKSTVKSTDEDGKVIYKVVYTAKSYNSYYPGDRVGIVALSTGTVKLTIHQEGGNSNESFLYRIKGKTLGDVSVDLTVSVKGGKKTTIEIVAGEYTVTEIPSWSWRYNDGKIVGDGETVGNADCALVKLKDKPIEYCGTYELIWVIEEDEDGKQSMTTKEVLSTDVADDGSSVSNWTIVKAITETDATEETPAALTYATIKLTTMTKEAVVTFTYTHNDKTWVGGENYGNTIFPPKNSEQTKA